MQPASMMFSSYSMFGYSCWWMRRAHCRNSPSVTFMMLALWKTVILRRWRRVANRKAQWAMRRLALLVATFMLITTSSVTWFSTPL